MLETPVAEAADGRVAMVVGASSTIANALIKQLISDSSYSEIIAISRNATDQAGLATQVPVYNLASDYSEASIKEICEQLASRRVCIRRVFICNGVLHDSDISPEKRIEDITADNLKRVFEVNAVIPMLWIKHLKPLVTSKQECVISAFSARIGSIEDNQRGGWYSYRSSKAALNMLLKTAAIEYFRVARNVRFLVFHPGTTDTPLSKPFQKFVKEDKLFSPEFVATHLLRITDQIAAKPAKSSGIERNIQFLDWNNQSIPW